ncbi:hypothetical protein CDEST_11550 [Colletotrichum destructivum]|uniref:Uncharacterized protein n=1 Tax=Colletotrichum destructivum TaxID=34406 RepID=A0AAX4ITF1_9PEZI|nr:hypothetical protein CDEST_11550 [Colletotrichum destructivum]
MVAKICIQFNAGVDISRTLCSLLPSLSRVSLAPSALGWNRRESGQAQPHVRNSCRSDARVSVPHVDAPCLAWPFTFLGFCYRRRRCLPLSASPTSSCLTPLHEASERERERDIEIEIEIERTLEDWRMEVSKCRDSSFLGAACIPSDKRHTTLANARCFPRSDSTLSAHMSSIA